MSQPGEDTTVHAQLATVRATVDHLTGFEGQGRSLVVDMVQEMLAHIADGGGLAPVKAYVGRYCDVIASDAEAEEIAAEIESELQAGNGHHPLPKVQISDRDWPMSDWGPGDITVAGLVAPLEGCGANDARAAVVDEYGRELPVIGVRRHLLRVELVVDTEGPRR